MEPEVKSEDVKESNIDVEKDILKIEMYAKEENFNGIIGATEKRLRESKSRLAELTLTEVEQGKGKN